MCVIFFYVNSNPEKNGYKLILASNRDEFYARDTRSVSRWEKVLPVVYGGVDLEPGREGGTWLAIGGHKSVVKVGALLNLTGEPKPRNAVEEHNNIIPYNNHKTKKDLKNATAPTKTTRSSIQNDNFLLGRGMIVSDFVTSTEECSIEDYNRSLVKDCTKYSPFNFVSIEIGPRTTPAQVILCSNVPPTLEYFNEGKCYGFGNSLPSIPFEKVRNGQKRFQIIVDEFHQSQKHGSNSTPAVLRNELIENLFNLLKCEEKFWPDEELKRRAPNWGEYLSAINVNISNEGYGSRTHTVILVDANDKMHLIEQTMTTVNPADEWSQTHIEKQLFKEDDE